MRGYCGVYQSFSAWSCSDYTPFQVEICLIIFFKNLAPCRFRHPQNFLEAFFWKQMSTHFFGACNFELYLAWFVNCIVGSFFAEPQWNVAFFLRVLLWFFKVKEDIMLDVGGRWWLWWWWLRPSILKVPFAFFNLESVFEGEYLGWF